MPQANSKSASSGWGWGTDGPPTFEPPQRGPSPPRGGHVGAILAAVVFLGIVSLGAVAFALATSEDGAEPLSTAEKLDAASANTAAAAGHPKQAAAETDAPKTDMADADTADADTAAVEVLSPAVNRERAAEALSEIAWTTDAPSTLEELSTTWAIPRDVLTKLNPGLPATEQIETGASVIVHSHTLGESSSIGPPNNGRLSGGVPLPEGEAWLPPFDRSRAFATTETLTSLTASLATYGQRFPKADPIQVGDLSARRGGEIYGHQSHQSGLDVDIRLVRDASGEGFDAGRNWFLVKTLIDGGDVTSMFLNNTEQTWLRAAAEADVGAASAGDYFALIRHEPGHTIHTHVRFVCPKQSKRCVNYPLPDTHEEAPKTVSKLPSAGGKLIPGKPKLPTVLTPKSPAVKPTTTTPTKKKKKKKKKGKK